MPFPFSGGAADDAAVFRACNPKPPPPIERRYGVVPEAAGPSPARHDNEGFRTRDIALQ